MLLSPDDAVEILLGVKFNEKPPPDVGPDCFSPTFEVDESVSESRGVSSARLDLLRLREVSMAASGLFALHQSGNDSHPRSCRRAK
jgi:hypothetical protein